MRKIGVGLLGCGVVGSAVVRNIRENAHDIAARCGAEFEIKKIAVRDTGKKRPLPNLAESILTTDINEVVSSNDIDIVIELFGGEEKAYSAIQKAMKGGKHVVTANKLLLAKKGEALFKLAIDSGVELGFEASVAGAIPVIRTIKEAIAGGGIKSIFGIINGTANYILTSMTENGTPFDDALKEAQKLGYAEADPAFDIEGTDTAHKITILANLAFGAPVDFDSVHTEGISGLAPEDFEFAKQFGRVIKLLATARLEDGRLDVRVHPAMVGCKKPIAAIGGVTNAVELEAPDTGKLMLIGAGAGGGATSSAVVADMVEIARNIEKDAVGRISPFAFRPSARKSLPMKPIGDVKTGYYLRFLVDDKPGVLANMAGILGDNGISIDSVIQKGRSGEAVPLVILTHEAIEKDLRAAIEKIDRLETTRANTKVIRLEDDV